MSSTIRPKSQSIAKRVIEDVAELHGAKKKQIANNEFALASRIRALEFEAEALEVHTSEELKSQLAYARIVLKMPLR